MSTNNHPELCGFETRMRQLIDRYNIATRDKTLLAMADAAADMAAEVRKAEWTINDLIRTKNDPR